jgi:hypothetical protein
VASLSEQDPDKARDAVSEAIKALDKAAQKGVIHANSAARRKSQLALKYNAAAAALETPAEESRPRRTRKPARKKTTK